MPFHALRTLVMGITWCAFGKLATAQNTTAPHATAQLPGVAVAPHVVVLTPHHPTGRVVVFNPHATAAEFTIELRYGLVTSDTSGHTIVRLQDDPANATNTAVHASTLNIKTPRINAAAETPTYGTTSDATRAQPPNAAPWITPYPRKFTLNPGASQVIHLTAKPPANTPPGEYWTRLIIHSRNLAPPLPTRADTDSTVRIGLTLEMSTIIPIFYRTGDVTTGIAIDSLTATPTNDSLVVHATLRRTGNSAYIGIAHLTLTDAKGTIVVNTPKRLAVYTTLSPRWTLPLPPHTLGPYHLTLLLTTNRPDAPKGTIIRAPAIGRTLDNVIW